MGFQSGRVGNGHSQQPLELACGRGSVALEMVIDIDKDLPCGKPLNVRSPFFEDLVAIEVRDRNLGRRHEVVVEALELEEVGGELGEIAGADEGVGERRRQCVGARRIVFAVLAAECRVVSTRCRGEATFVVGVAPDESRRTGAATASR